MTQSRKEVHVVIPARLAAERLPNKPIVDVLGRPLVVRVYEAVLDALGGQREVDIAVAIDDTRTEIVLADYDIPIVMTDPSATSGTDRVAEVARVRGWASEDLILNVQGDEPLLPSALLEGFVEYCRHQTNFTMATVAVPISDVAEIKNPNVVKLTTRSDSTAMIFSRAPIPFDRDSALEHWEIANYRRHVGIYAYSNEVLQRLVATPACVLERVEKLEQLRPLWLNIPIQIFSWPESPPLGVDTPEDLRRVIKVLAGER